MRTIARLAAAVITIVGIASPASAQRQCKKGIPCGNSCIAANRTCRVGTPAAASAPAEATPAPVRSLIDSSALRPKDSSSALGAQVGGGSTKVWVNRSSHIYHCPGSRNYGTTKNGVFMSEKDAMAQGNRGAYGRRCDG